MRPRLLNRAPLAALLVTLGGLGRAGGAPAASVEKLQLLVEAGPDQAAVQAAVEKVIADSPGHALVPRAPPTEGCCGDTPCALASLEKSGATGLLVVRAAQVKGDSLAVAKIVRPGLRRMPRALALRAQEPPAGAASFAVTAMLASSVPDDAYRTAAIPLRAEGDLGWSDALLYELVLAGLTASGKVDAMGQPDIDDLLGPGITASNLGPGRKPGGCYTELGDALGVDYIATANIDRLGGGLVLSAKLIAVKQTKVVGRISAAYDGSLVERTRSLAQAMHDLPTAPASP